MRPQVPSGDHNSYLTDRPPRCLPAWESPIVHAELWLSLRRNTR